MSRLALVVLALVVLCVVGFVLFADDALGGADDVVPVVGGPEERRSGGTVLPEGTPRPDGPDEPRPLAPDAPPRDARPAAVAAETPEMPPGRTVSGRVERLWDRTPIVGARVVADASDGSRATTHSLGTPPGAFVLEHVHHDASEVVVELDGPWPMRRSAYDIETGEEDVDALVLVVDSGFPVAGLVTDESGAPLAGAVVDAQQKQETVADAGGRFRLTDVAPAEGRESVEIGARAPWFQRGSDDVLVPRGPGATPEVHLVLVGGGAIEGRVLDPDDEPVAGAPVELVFEMTTAHGRRAPGGLETTSGADGRYRLDHVKAGRWVVEAKPGPFDETHVDTWVPEVVVDTGRVTRLDIVLPRAATVAGRVRDAYGAPVAGAEVRMDRVLRWPAPDVGGSSTTTSSDLRITSRGAPDGSGETVLTLLEGEATTDADGTYLLESVTPGEKRLGALVPDGDFTPAEETLHVEGGREHIADFLLDAGLVLRSRVVDVAGLPIEGASAQVSLDDSGSFDGSHRATTDADGCFELTGLPARELGLLIHADGYLSLFEDVDPAAAPPEYVLRPAPRVVGRVVDAALDEPVTRYTLRIEYTRGSMSNQSQFPDGEFAIDVVDDEPVVVSVEAPGYLPQSIEGVVPSSTEVRPLEFRLLREP